MAGKGEKQWCAAIGCKKNGRLNRGLCFLTFPKDVARCQKWITNMKRTGVVPEVFYAGMNDERKKDLKSTKSMSLCENHFAIDQYNCPADKGTAKHRKSFIRNAVPTLFPELLCLPQPKVTKQRHPVKRLLRERTNTTDLKKQKGEKSQNIPITETMTSSVNKIPRKTTNCPSKSVFCGYCAKMVSSRAALQVHVRTHTGERPFKCPQCTMAFTQITNLTAHQRRHTGERPYVCELCDRGFKQLSNLQAHERTHTGEKPYKCDYCDKSFCQLSNLLSHKNTHSTKRKFKCDECDQDFKTIHEFYSHKKIHDKVPECLCSFCDRAFQRKIDLKKHLIDDHPDLIFHYVCSVCSEVFDSETVMKSHKKEMHNYIRSHICAKCTKRFSNAGTLRAHVESCNVSFINKLINGRIEAIKESLENSEDEIMHALDFKTEVVVSPVNVKQEIVDSPVNVKQEYLSEEEHLMVSNEGGIEEEEKGVKIELMEVNSEEDA